jgi:hypothetical protein
MPGLGHHRIRKITVTKPGDVRWGLRLSATKKPKYPEAEFLDGIGDKSLKSFPPCYSGTPYRIITVIISLRLLLTNFTPLPRPLSKSGLKLVCNVNIAYKNLKYANSQVYQIMPRNLNEIHEFIFRRD